MPKGERTEAEAIPRMPKILPLVRGRIGDYVVRRVDGETVFEHRPKQKRTRPPTERELANRALQERIKAAYDALTPEEWRRWEIHAYDLRKPRKKSQGGGWDVPRPFSLFSKAMGERWRNDPDAPPILDPFAPSLPAAATWHGDGI